MLKTAIRFVLLTTAIAGIGTTFVLGAANAATPADVPLCSRTITDKCMNPTSPATTHANHHARHSSSHGSHAAVTGKGAAKKG